MKKIILSTAMFLLSVFVFAQSERYTAAMKKNLASIDTAMANPASLLSLSNNFERIGNAEKNQWLPFYYAALCQVNYGFMETDKTKVDGYADKATALIQKADSLAPNNSEISCMKSMIASCHMLVDPMNRWMQYGQESSSNLAAAISQDPSNPRPHFLKGQGLKYTPEQFGGGCKTALPELQTAIQKYDAFKKESEISPDWGKELVEKLISDCK
ncbi:MAG: hypothetical protein ABJB11_23900 [Ferruginibacter sp.]